MLREFGKVLENATRGGDIAARYGGEEFAVVMIDCPAEGALKRADEIRRNTERIAIEFHRELLGGISASIGIANFPGDANTIDQLISRADEALYAAKSNGRNCSVYAGELDTADGNKEPLKAVTAK